MTDPDPITEIAESALLLGISRSKRLSRFLSIQFKWQDFQLKVNNSDFNQHKNPCPKVKPPTDD